MKARLQLLAGGIGFIIAAQLYQILLMDLGSQGWFDKLFYYTLMGLGGVFFIALLILLFADFLPVVVGTITRGFDFLMGFVKGFRVVKNSRGGKR